MINRKLLPAMHTHMVGAQSKGRQLRVPVAIATVKLAMILPTHQFHVYLPRLLADVANALRSRRQDTRDRAKRGYALICASLGPQYLQHAVQQLRMSLREGYQVHVLGHAVHAVLGALAPAFISAEVQPTSTVATMCGRRRAPPRQWLDESLGAIMPILVDDIFGASSRQKDSLQKGEFQASACVK